MTLRLLFILLLLCYPLFSQRLGIIAGRITDSTSKIPLKDVEITLVNTSVGTYSSEEGLFYFKAQPGEYTIKAQIVGYVQIEKQVAVYSDKISKINFMLASENLTIDPLIIQGSRPDRSVMDVELSHRLLAKFPALAESDAFRSVQILPSVSLPNDYSGQLYIRGSRFDQTLITFNDIPVYNPYHLGGLFGTFNADAISKIDFYPGVSFANKSSRLAGHLNVTPNDGKDNKTKISLGVLSSRIQTGRKFKNVSYFISARRAYIDLLELMFEDSNDRVGYSFYDIISKFDWQLNKKHKLSSAIFFSRDLLNYAPAEGERDSFNRLYPKWGNLVFSLDWKYFINKKIYSETKFGYTDATVLSGTKNIDVDNIIRHFMLTNRFVITSANHLVQTGFEINRIDYRYHWFLESDNELENMIGKPQFIFFDNAPADYDFNKNTIRLSLYLQDEIHLLQNTNINVGFRYVYNTLSSTSNLLPRIQINYNLNSFVTFSSAYAKHTQYDYTLKEIKNSYFFAPFSVYLPIEKQEQPLLSDYYTLGLKLSDLSYGSLNTEVYYKQMNSIPSINLYTGFKEKNKGRALGFELLYRKQFNDLTFISSYALSYSKVIKKTVSYFSSFDRRHNVKMFAAYEMGNGWRVSTFWTYLSGLPYTPYMGNFIGAGMNGRENSDFDFTHPGYFSTNIGQVDIGRNSKRYSAYHRMDVGIEKDWMFTDKILSLKLQVINVYNHKNVAFINYNSDISNQGPEKKNNLPIIPSLEISYEF